MFRADYQCQECGRVHEYWKKPDEENFPKEIDCVYPEKITKLNPRCSGKMIRLWNSAPTISIGEGMAGNSDNNFTKSTTYKPSPLTPLSAIKSKDYKSYDV